MDWKMCECGHYESDHIVYMDDVFRGDVDTLVRKCHCGCQMFKSMIDADDFENSEKISATTYKVKLGDKLEVNGHIFVISEINTRVFQTPQLKIQSLMEFMEITTDEK